MNTKSQVNRTDHPITRRAFLRRTTAAVSATLAAPLVVPARVLGADGTVAPSNRINVGFIGTGRQVFHANLPWHLASEETQDFVNCIKTRKETMIPAEIGHRTASLCQIAQVAIQTRVKLKWNPETERFVDHDEANQLLSRPQRAPWNVEG